MKKIYLIIAALFLAGLAYSQPANDNPCGAFALTLGVNISDDNTTATAEGVPAVPTCWSGGTVNSLWYSVVCPASGQLRIKTIPLSSGNPLQNTQIAVYSGTCGALTEIVCNDNAPNCGTYTQVNSEVSLTGLTPGATYFIRVDGNANLVGQYQILAINGTGTFPIVAGQDCSVPQQLCNSTTTIGNPGFQVIGGICDHDGTSNCTSGEANSVWYTINIGSAGNLNFDIVPNDFGNPNPITGQVNPGYTGVGAETDYDWVLWKVAGAGSTTCANIASSGGGGAAACNFDFLGVTGTSNSGNAPGAYPGFNFAYEPSPAVVAGEVYVLVIQNFSNSTSGFTLQFPAGTPVTFNPTVVTWTGGANTSNWNTAMNWGNCNVPNCAGPSFDAIISAGSAFQPVLTAGVYSVRNITINAGATLTLQAGANLQICGNFVNNGNINALPGSTVTFINNNLQTCSGSFTGGNALHHTVVNKGGGSVILVNDWEANGDFTTSNGTSIFNTSNRYIRVGGNFNNFNGNTTFSTTGALGTLEFDGTGAQTYNQGASQLDLNFVVMNNTGTGVTLLSDMFIKTATGTLTLTNGRIHTGAFRVDVANNAAACVTVGTATSYVNGNLHRTVAAAGGAYNFPVGTATLYERALITLAANTYNRLQARFDPWPVGPNTLGLSECTATYSLPSENMGYWTINQTGANTGTYNTTLFANGATNTAGASGWTVEKSTSVAGPWILNGVCAASTATIVNRTGMSGFSVLAVAQSPTPLPVQLTEFDGEANGDQNFLSWTTESETNNSHFILQKSIDGVNYTDIERLEGAPNGNSNTTRNYSAVDENPFGVTYYQLRQVDFNGDYTMYGPITITNNNVDEFEVHNVYPNPAKESFFIELFSKNELETEVTIFDSFGRMVYGKPAIINGQVTLEIQSAGWSTGIYTIKVENESKGYQFIKRVVIGK